MGSTFSQFYPPHPTLTEQNLPSQKGKVFIVTGGYLGIGYQLTTLLFQASGKVYVAGRSEPKARRAIEEIKYSVPETSSTGQLEYLQLELDDLSTIKASVDDFKSKERNLDVLWNNAGVSLTPVGSLSKQGSFIVDLTAPKGGIDMADLTTAPQDQNKNYTNSKTGSWFLAAELGREVRPLGILSITQNPGNLKTNLFRHTSKWYQWAISPLLYSAKMGAYTELWAGLSSEVAMEIGGGYVVPFGRMHSSARKDLLDALRSVEDLGTGQAGQFRAWCEKQTVEYR